MLPQKGVLLFCKFFIKGGDKMNFFVITPHRTNYPNPISLNKGQTVIVGKTYEGHEDWHHWIYCYTTDRKQEGWVPEQILRIQEKIGLVLEDYTANELNEDTGEIVVGEKELNGWLWCEQVKTGEVGWVPKVNLKSE
jgi:hypothetical protein